MIDAKFRETYLIFIVEGYEDYKEDDKTYIGVCRFEIIARTEKEAMHKARQLIKCNHYKVWGVSERNYGNT